MAVQLQLSSDKDGSPVTNAATGDRFTTDLSTPVIVDGDIEDYSVQVVTAAAWYTSPNVSAVLGNNKFEYTSATVAPTGTFTITVPDGLYSTEDLTKTIADLTTQNGHGTNDFPLFTFNALEAVQKVSITVDASNTIGTGFSIDNTIADSLCQSLFSFPSGVLGPTTASPETFTPTALADMAQGKNEYLIQTDLIRGSIATDGNPGQAILRLPLNSRPNAQLTYQSTLSTLSLPLARKRTDKISVWITDGNSRPITLNGNPFSITLAVIKKTKDQITTTERQI